MSPLEARDGELVGRRRALAPRAGDGRGAVGCPTRDLVEVHQLPGGVGDAGDHHPLVVEEGVQVDEGRLLAAVLTGGGGEGAADLADERPWTQRPPVASRNACIEALADP